MPLVRGRYIAEPSIHVTAAEETEFAYLAGIMDGEGYFSGSGKTRSFGLRVAMIDKCVIDWLHAHFGGSVSQAGMTVAGNRVHTWVLARQADLRYVLPRLEPYLVLKRRQADAMLTFVKHLESPPDLAYETPTSRAPKPERARRREARVEWKAERERLRHAVADARR